jgi:hypothetical protein
VLKTLRWLLDGYLLWSLCLESGFCVYELNIIPSFPIIMFSKINTQTLKQNEIQSRRPKSIYGVERHIQQYISFIAGVSLFVEEAGVLGENHSSSASHWQTVIEYTLSERYSNSLLKWWYQLITQVVGNSTTIRSLHRRPQSL